MMMMTTTATIRGQVTELFSFYAKNAIKPSSGSSWHSSLIHTVRFQQFNSRSLSVTYTRWRT